MTLGRRVHELRMKSGESLQELADLVGVSKAHIWEIEKERTLNPAMNLVKRLADHFDKSVSWMIGEDVDNSDDEEQLSAMFRKARGLDENERALVKNMMNTLLDQKQKRKGQD